MIILRSGVVDSLFRNAAGPGWIGGVHCLQRNVECVPCKIGNDRYLIRFNIPYFLTQHEPYESILLETRDGGVFIPKLEHRYIDIISADGALTQNLCSVKDLSSIPNPGEFIKTLQDAVVLYYRNYPNANQFFFMFSHEAKEILLKTVTSISEGLSGKFRIEPHTDLKEPLYGFSITSDAL